MKTFLNHLMAATAVAGLATGSVFAVPTLWIVDSSGGSVQIADGSAADTQPLAGVVGWSGVVGNWSVNVSTGQTFPSLGTAAGPRMDLHTTVTSAAAGWNGIEIWFSADDFTSTNSGDVSASFGGTIYGLTNYEAGWDASNRLFSSATSPGFDYNYRFPQSLFDFQNISGTRSAYFTSNVPYSLTLMVDIGHFGAGTGSADFTLTVPDGGITALLLGFGLLGLRIMARRRVGFAKA